MITNKFLESLNVEFKNPKNRFLGDLLALRTQFLNESVLDFLHIQGFPAWKISAIEDLLDELNEACLTEGEKQFVDACEKSWRTSCKL